MWKIDTHSEIDLHEANIFDEFTWDEGEMKQWEQEWEEKEKKWWYDYLSIYSNILVWINIGLFVCFLIFLVYNHVQKSEKALNYRVPPFVCSLLLWDSSKYVESCNGITYTQNTLQQDVDEVKQQQAQLIEPLIGDVYGFENFQFSRKMAFLIEKSKNRLEPSKILAAFDAIKWKYASVDKSEIECYDIMIEQGNILQIRCDIYASDWDTEIFYFENGIKKTNTLGWGSISKAISFIDYIENDAFSPFQVRAKTQKFISEVVQKPPYTQKTSIELELEYVHSDLLLK